MSPDKLEAAVEECTEKSLRGLGMFEQFTKLVFTLLNEMRTLEVQVHRHDRDIDSLTGEVQLLKEIAEDNKEAYVNVSDSLLQINANLSPILKKNRKLDKAWSYMGWIGTASVVFTLIVLVMLFVGDTSALISFISKVK